MPKASLVPPKVKVGVPRRPSHPSKRSLAQCQVSTPDDVVELVWKLVADRRRQVEAVVDLGAGHCQFAVAGRFASYKGVEIDPKRGPTRQLPNGAELVYEDALDIKGAFDLAIGNPPYTRHHRIGKRWKRQAREHIKAATGTDVSEFANLYLYFVWLSLLRTRSDGLLALVIPYEWVSRPSSASLRSYLHDKGYRVDVYRFEKGARVFADVKTTACIALIDKAAKGTAINCWELQGEKSVPVGVTAGRDGVLPYATRATAARAFRGLSTGSQAVFLLTEAERKAAGIQRHHVVPCISSLRALDSAIKDLDKEAFEEHYVNGGRKCWLLKTEGPLDEAVTKHLRKAPPNIRNNWTCRSRDTWYRFKLPRVPDILYSSGFRGRAPRIVENSVGARATGAAHGISTNGIGSAELAKHLRSFPFADRVVPHANGLLKVEVSQMNGVIADFEATMAQRP